MRSIRIGGLAGVSTAVAASCVTVALVAFSPNATAFAIVAAFLGSLTVRAELLLLAAVATVSYEQLGLATPVGNLRLTHVLLVMACLGSLLQMCRPRRLPWIALPAVLALVPLVFSVVAHPDLGIGLGALLAYSLNAGLVVIAISLAGANLTRDRLLSWYANGATVSAFLGLYQVIGYYAGLPTIVAPADFVDGLPRALGLSYEPAFFALAMILGVLALVAREQPASKWQFAVLALGALLSNARVIVILVVVLMIYGSLGRGEARTRRRTRRVLVFGGFAAGVVAASVFVAIPGSAGRLAGRVTSIGNTTEAASNAIRLRTFSSVLNAVRDGRMDLGIGPGRMGRVVDPYGYPAYALRRAQVGENASPAGAALGAYVADNVLLQALSDGGVLGVLGLGSGVLVLWRGAGRTNAPLVMRSTLIAAGVAGSLVSLGYDPKLWALLAILTMRPRLATPASTKAVSIRSRQGGPQRAVVLK